MYAKYLDLYGVSLNTLLAVVEEDQRRHDAEYRALQAIRESHAEGSRRERNKKNARDKRTFCRICAANLRVSVGPLPAHTDHKGNPCKGAGLRGVSVEAARASTNPKKKQKQKKKKRPIVGDSDFWYSGSSVRTVGGGLPGLGKRR